MIAKPHHDRWSEIAKPHSDRWSENDKGYLLQLIREGEHQQQDFKYRVADACKLAKSVSAFANTDGGRLLIGVRDDGNLSGVRSEEEIYMMHQAAYKYCRPEASIKFDTYHVEGRTIVIATVPPSEHKPVCALNALLARLIRFNVAHWHYTNQQFIFEL